MINFHMDILRQKDKSIVLKKFILSLSNITFLFLMKNICSFKKLI